MKIMTKVVTGVIKSLEGSFGKMTVNRGKCHNLVGMNFSLLKDGNLKIIMKEYLEECIDSFGELGSKIKITIDLPGGHDLFKVDEKLDKLDTEKSEMFHHIVAKLLFVAKRSHLDIETTISFLCIRVTRSTYEDWLKLIRLLCYLKGTLEMPKIIGADILIIVQCWAEASYAIHIDMKGHTSEVTSFVHEGTHLKFTKQKMNSKNSTGAEIVAASDYLGYTVWLAGFIKDHGYPISRRILPR